jgi:hypothetical protein
LTGRQVASRVATVPASPETAAEALEALADVAVRSLPERSAGRRRIVEAAGRAAAAWRELAALAPRPRVGDDRADQAARAAGLAAARRAVAESRRAVEQARRTSREVRSMPERALAAAWDVATAPPRAVRDTIASALAAAADRAERVVTATTTTAATAWGGAVQGIGVAGIVALAVAVWWLTKK